MKKIFLTLIVTLLSGVAFAQNFVWYNPIDDSQNNVWGRGHSSKNYARLPDCMKNVVREDVWGLSRHAAGLSLKFVTNAKNIKVRYVVDGGYSLPHMPATGVSGVDLYMNDGNSENYWLRGRYSFSDTITYSYYDFQNSPKGNQFDLFLPLYNSIKWLEIGVDSGSNFEFVEKSNEKPIVIYGTSIAQGACASRPGIAWVNILSRRLNMPIVSLGFSGNGLLEKELFDYISPIEAKVIIIDCMPNIVDKRAEKVYELVIAGVKQLREKNNSPILLVEHDGYMNERSSQSDYLSVDKVNKGLKKAYNDLMEMGVKDLYYLDKKELGQNEDSQVDGVHPTDYGMVLIADGYEKALKDILD